MFIDNTQVQQTEHPNTLSLSIIIIIIIIIILRHASVVHSIIIT
jgi:hypothetical protein